MGFGIPGVSLWAGGMASPAFIFFCVLSMVWLARCAILRGACLGFVRENSCGIFVDRYFSRGMCDEFSRQGVIPAVVFFCVPVSFFCVGVDFSLLL